MAAIYQHRHTVRPSPFRQGHWVADVMTARKIDGLSFGTCGIKTRFLGSFKTRDEAIAAMRADQRKLGITTSRKLGATTPEPVAT